MALIVYVWAGVTVFGVIPASELATSTSPFADLAAVLFAVASVGWLWVRKDAKLFVDPAATTL